MSHVTLLQVVLLFLSLHATGQGPSRPAQKPVTRNPHGTLNIPCENCHTSLSWKPIRSTPEFSHDSTRYPLRGMHKKVQCTQCHVKLVFTNVGQKCSDCHADIHHGQFGANCESCHTVKGWMVSVQAIRYHENRFPLNGTHAAVDCDSCHKGAATGQFQGLSAQCDSCHLRDYNTAATPLNHIQLGFPRTCESCHDTVAWTDGKFNHSATGFPLTGFHTTLACSACHVNKNYNLTRVNAACVACHLRNYQNTTNPNHAQLGFSTTCEVCHNTTAWKPAAFDHSKTAFPLTGAHISVPCASCHVNNNYTTLPTDCYGCHKAAYDSTTNPIHNAAPTIFTTACATCHNTTSWLSATFNHTWFLIPHHNAQCANCHSNPHDYTVFVCTVCHTQAATSPPVRHNGVTGYVWNSTACYQCHKR